MKKKRGAAWDRDPDQQHEYHSADGSCVAVELRWYGSESGTRKKEIRPLTSPDGGRTWYFGCPSRLLPPLPVFNLPSLLERVDEDVLWVEGPKAATAAAHMGSLATTSFGCKGLEAHDLTPLSGRRVYVLPDNDDKGEEKAATAADYLRRKWVA